MDKLGNKRRIECIQLVRRPVFLNHSSTDPIIFCNLGYCFVDSQTNKKVIKAKQEGAPTEPYFPNNFFSSNRLLRWSISLLAYEVQGAFRATHQAPRAYRLSH